MQLQLEKVSEACGSAFTMRSATVNRVLEDNGIPDILSPETLRVDTISPLGAASIGQACSLLMLRFTSAHQPCFFDGGHGAQVHRGCLTQIVQGAQRSVEIAVKVQYPGIAARMDRDVDFLLSWLKRLNIIQLDTTHIKQVNGMD